MIEFKISFGDFTIVETLHPVEEMKKVLLNGLKGKLGFPGIIDSQTPVKDSMFDILLKNFNKDFNNKTTYDLVYKGKNENTLYFDEKTTKTKDIAIEIN